MAMFGALSAIVLPIFITAGIGLVWSRMRWPFDSNLVSILVYKIAVPCLIIAIFAKSRLTPEAIASVAGAAVVIYLATAAIAAGVLRFARLPLPSYLPSIMFPMVGSIGLPVCLFALGEDGLALALVFFTLGAIGTFTIGAAIAAGRVSLAKLFGEPAIWAAAAAITLLLLDVTLPKWIVDTTGLLGGIAIPLQLIALGCSLGQFRVTSLPRGVLLSLLRLGLGFGVGFVIAEAFACSLPVVASRLGAMRELIEDGVTGLHFQPVDPADLAAKVRWAAENPSDMRRMGENARRVYEDRYTPESNYRELMAIYDGGHG